MHNHKHLWAVPMLLVGAFLGACGGDDGTATSAAEIDETDVVTRPIPTGPPIEPRAPTVSAPNIASRFGKLHCCQPAADPGSQ